MLIKQKSIRSLEKYLRNFNDKETFLVGLADLETHKKKLKQIGFTKKIAVGEQVLPKVIGKTSDFNANGKEIKLRDLPKVKKTRVIHTTWQDWHGYPHSGMVYREYKVFQTELIPPPCIELTIVETVQSQKILQAGVFEKTEHNSQAIIHAINLLLELFGECEILTGEGARAVGDKKLKRLNWEVLPKGKYPWKKAKDIVEKIIEDKDKSQQHVLRHNFEAITRHEPDFIAVGKGGFSGYLICGFKDQKCYVLESTQPDNATYVFSKNCQGWY
jgi:hypothetical protein